MQRKLPIDFVHIKETDKAIRQAFCLIFAMQSWHDNLVQQQSQLYSVAELTSKDCEYPEFSYK